MLTIVIPTLNEADDLPRTLKSVKFADELLVIDSGSTDNTVAIAKKLGAKVIKHEFVNFKELRNFADRKAKHDWILSIEADVVVPPELAEEINAAVKGEPAAYKIGRINIIFGKEILHSDWGPHDDNHIRLYHRSLGKWQGEVHEQFVAPQARQLQHRLLHYNYKTVEEYLDKINFYSELEVKRRVATGKKFSIVQLLWEPMRDFGKRFFYKLGFFDGLHGLFLACLQAIYYLTVNIKMYTQSQVHHDH